MLPLWLELSYYPLRSPCSRMQNVSIAYETLLDVVLLWLQVLPPSTVSSPSSPLAPSLSTEQNQHAFVASSTWNDLPPNWKQSPSAWQFNI